MALESFKKLKGSSAFAKSLSEINSGNLLKAAIHRVDRKGTILESEVGTFMLNPSTFEETKSANWNQKRIPGQSDPTMQWSGSGPRVVTFDALITADTSYFDDAIDRAPGKPKNKTEEVLTKIADISGSFFNVSVPPPRIEEQTSGKGDTLDISRYLNYYRSLLYPEYDSENNPSRLQQSPPLVVLYFGRSLITKAYEKRISNNHEVWVVTNLRIRVTKQLPNLAPMEAVVSFTLQQYNIKSFDTKRFLK